MSDAQPAARHAEQGGVEDRRVRQCDELRRQQAALRLARAGGIEGAFARTADRRRYAPEGNADHAGGRGARRGQREAGAPVRDGGPVPPAREARLSGPSDRRRAQPAGRTGRQLSPDRRERRGVSFRRGSARLAASGVERPDPAGVPACDVGVDPRPRSALSGRARRVLVRPRRLHLGLSPGGALAGRPLYVHVPARRLPPPLREHAVPLDLRRQRGAPAGPRALPALVPRDRHRRDALPRARRAAFADSARRRLGRDLGYPRVLLRLVPAQPGSPAVAPPPVRDAGLRGAGAARARRLPRAGEPAAVPDRARRRRRGARRAHRRVRRRAAGGLAHGPFRDGCATGGVRGGAADFAPARSRLAGAHRERDRPRPDGRCRRRLFRGSGARQRRYPHARAFPGAGPLAAGPRSPRRRARGRTPPPAGLPAWPRSGGRAGGRRRRAHGCGPADPRVSVLPGRPRPEPESGDCVRRSARNRRGRGASEAADRSSACPSGLTPATQPGKRVRGRGGIMSGRHAVGIAVACGLSLAACAKPKPPPPPVAVASVKEGKNSIKSTNVVTATATVLAINHRTRMVTLLRSDGERVRFRVGDEVRNLSQVRKGDQVNVTYYESIALHLRKPGTGRVGVTVDEDAARAQPGELPAGAVAREVTVTSKVVGIDRQNQSATLQLPDRERMTFPVQDPSRLDRVRVGDLVQLTYREAIAIAVAKP